MPLLFIRQEVDVLSEQANARPQYGCCDANFSSSFTATALARKNPKSLVNLSRMAHDERKLTLSPEHATIIVELL